VKPITFWAVLALLLCTGCDRSGLSKQFRKPALDALERIRHSDESGGAMDLEQADRAIVEAKAVTANPQDMQMADFMDWYSTVLHRHDRDRTKPWRQLCNWEAGLYLEGRQSGLVRAGGQEVRVVRGSCQKAAFEMMQEDCLRTGRSAADCVPPGS
jgi:hypothetical protein